MADDGEPQSGSTWSVTEWVHVQKAGGDKVLAFAQLDPRSSGSGVREPVAPRPSPADEAELRATLQEVAPHVTDELPQNLVCDRIMGYTIEEMAPRQGIARRTVLRRLQRVLARQRDAAPPRS